MFTLNSTDLPDINLYYTMKNKKKGTSPIPLDGLRQYFISSIRICQQLHRNCFFFIFSSYLPAI